MLKDKTRKNSFNPIPPGLSRLVLQYRRRPFSTPLVFAKLEKLERSNLA